jgi:hypothetical protein
MVAGAPCPLYGNDLRGLVGSQETLADLLRRHSPYCTCCPTCSLIDMIARIASFSTQDGEVRKTW